MTSRERDPSAHRKSNKDEAERETAAAAESSPPQETSSKPSRSGPRLWALPRAGGGTWPIWENAELIDLSRQLSAQPPQILCAHADRASDMLNASAYATDRMMRHKGQDALFDFMKGVLVSGAFILAGVVAWRLPGELKYLDLILLATGGAYFLYNLLWNGRHAMQWHHRRVDAMNAYTRGTVTPCQLCDRLSDALKLRLSLKEAERGKSPDDELLDTNAYRKLIKDGVTTVEELCALGRAVEEQLSTKASLGVERRLADVAAESGVDLNTAIFYRDLANAAAELRIEHHVNEAFGETSA